VLCDEAFCTRPVCLGRASPAASSLPKQTGLLQNEGSANAALRDACFARLSADSTAITPVHPAIIPYCRAVPSRTLGQTVSMDNCAHLVARSVMFKEQISVRCIHRGGLVVPLSVSNLPTLRQNQKRSWGTVWLVTRRSNRPPPDGIPQRSRTHFLRSRFSQIRLAVLPGRR
jgi:hypothetical protein